MTTTYENRTSPRPGHAIMRIGVAFLALGILAILLPAITTTALVVMGGVALLIWGVLGAWMSHEVTNRPFGLITLGFGLLAVVGLLFLIFPTWGAEALTLLVVAGLLMEGLFDTLLALSLRDRMAGWIALFASGVLALVIGFLILIGWPGTATWLLGLALGANFAANGIALIILDRRLQGLAAHRG